MAVKVLIIDDDLDDRKTVATILGKNGYKVTMADGGKKGLNIIEKEKFDLVLLNIIMPELSGYDVLEILKKKKNPGFKIMFISIMPEKEVYTEGVDGFIQKPFSPQTLLQSIKKVTK